MATFNIVIQTQVNQAVSGIRQVGNELGNVEKVANRLRSLIQQTFAIAGIGFGLKELINLSDTYTKLENRIKLVTNSTSELRAVQSRLFEVANSTRASYDSTVTLYTRMSSSTKQLGISQQELIDVVQSVNQAVAISGATSIESHNALIQFSQGLASARLGGEELRSVLEQLPAIADVIAKHLHTTRGALRDLAAQGILTPKIIIEAFKEAREELGIEFAKVAPTIGQSFTVLNNQILNFIGETNKGTGAAQDLARVILFLANNFKTLAEILEGVLITSLVRYTIGVIPAAIAATKAFTLSLMANPLAAIGAALLYIISLLYVFADRIAIPGSAMAKLSDVFKVVIRDITNYFAGLFDFVMKGLHNIPLEFAAAGKGLTNAMRRLAGFKPIENTALKEIQPNALPSFGGDSKLSLSERIDFEARDRFIKQRVAELDKERALDSLSKPGIAVDTPTKAKKLDTFSATIKKLQEENKALGLSKSQRELANKEIELEFKLRKSLTPQQKLQYEALLAENQLLRNKAEILDQLQEPQEKLNQGAAALSSLMKEGKISIEEYTTKLDELRLGALDAGRDLSTGIQRGLIEIHREFENVADVASNLLVDSFRRAEDALVEFTKMGKLNFKDLIDSMLTDLIRLQIRQNITAPLAGILGSVGSSIFGGQGAISRIAQTGSADFVGPLPGFASGGSFTVGGESGVDKNLIAFKATKGEHVNITRPGDSGKNVTVTVINNAPNSQARTQERNDGQGGKSIDVIIDEITAKNISSLGSRSNNALRKTFGVNNQLVNR